MAEKIYVKLGKATNFWDPTQNEDSRKKVSGDAIVEVERSPKVNAAISQGGLVIASKSDFESYSKKYEAKKKSSIKDASDLKAAKTSLKKAIKENDDLKSKITTLESSMENIITENDLLKEEIASLKPPVTEGSDDSKK